MSGETDEGERAEYRKSTVQYQWQQAFDQQSAEVQTQLARMLDEYPPQIVYTAMLQLLRRSLGDDLREVYGREYGEDYLPPRPETHPYACPQCDARFETAVDRDDHLKTEHPEKRGGH